jgi:PAS domain S-box-containing protein
LVICDISGSIQAFNPAAEQMFGVQASDVKDTFVGDLFFSESASFPQTKDATAVWNLLARLDVAEDEHDLMGRYSDGTTFLLDVNHTRLDRSDGSSIVLLVMRDIGSSCDEDRKTLKGYRSIFESSFDGILVVKDQQIVAANPAATKLFGYKVEEILATSMDALIMPGHKIDSTDDFRVHAKHHDGHLMEMEFTTTTIWWDSSPASLVTIKEVKSNSNKDFTPSMICCFDSSYRISFVNAAFANYYGSKKEELIGTDIRDLIPDNECSPFLIHINCLSEKEPTRKMKLRSTNVDGSPRVQIWTDHAAFENGVVEYQRIGYDISNTSTTIDDF